MIFSSNNIFVSQNFFGNINVIVETELDLPSDHSGFSDDEEPNYSLKEIDMR